MSMVGMFSMSILTTVSIILLKRVITNIQINFLETSDSVITCFLSLILGIFLEIENQNITLVVCVFY